MRGLMAFAVAAAVGSACEERDPRDRVIPPAELAIIQANARKVEAEAAEAAEGQRQLKAANDAWARAQAESKAWETKKRTPAELVKERSFFAKRLETELSGGAVEVTVEARGKDRTTYRVTSAACDADTTQQIAVAKNMFDAVQFLGVRRLECSDGNSVWTKTWSAPAH